MAQNGENNNVSMAVRDGVPIALGYLAVSFAFGIIATSAGLSAFEAVLISMFNVTSAGQLAAVPIISGGGGYIELIATQLVINLRYFLMSTSLSQRLGASVRTGDRFVVSFMNTDEIFATAVSKSSLLGRKYLYFLIPLPYLGWTAGTALGAIAGNVLPEILVDALGMALYAMFIAIILPVAKGSASTALCILISAILSAVFYFVPLLSAIPSGFTIIIIAVTVSLIFALVAPHADDGEAAEDECRSDGGRL